MISRFKPIPMRERFLTKFDKTDGCWPWKGAVNGCGYGMIRSGKTYRIASRVSYELHVGEIPNGLCVLHRCDMPRCVNPSHLFLGTQRENIADRHRKGRDNKKPTALGVSHYAAKLSANAVREIRVLYGLVSQRKLAMKFNVSGSTIYAVAKRQRYRDVE